jgi:hypothetical protein
MKILFLDIETRPDLVYTWGVYEQNAISVKEHWGLLSFSAKWRGGRRITKGLDDYPGYRKGNLDDTKMTHEIHALLDAADMVVAHNGAAFDMRKLNARFIERGLTPPSPYHVVDTKKEVRRVAAFSSNKLDWLSQQLELGHKLIHQGWTLWFDCMAGKPSAWKTMKRYNKHDVVLLERLYTLLAPWMRQPNANLYTKDEKMRCTNPICGSLRLENRGMQHNKTRSYTRYRCRDCGKYVRATNMVKDESQRSRVVEIG